jgi:hypothetical protein
MPQMKTIIAILILTISLLLIPFASAQEGEYLIPVSSAHWNITTIPIYIHGSHFYRNITLTAMKVWNQAQAWFNQ